MTIIGSKSMSKCELFLQTCNKFEWFIVKWFGVVLFDFCKKLAERGDESSLLSVLNTIWFDLPDDIFNIKENPEGWNEFLAIIEE